MNTYRASASGSAVRQAAPMAAARVHPRCWARLRHPLPCPASIRFLDIGIERLPSERRRTCRRRASCRRRSPQPSALEWRAGIYAGRERFLSKIVLSTAGPHDPATPARGNRSIARGRIAFPGYVSRSARPTGGEPARVQHHAGKRPPTGRACASIAATSKPEGTACESEHASDVRACSRPLCTTVPDPALSGHDVVPALHRVCILFPSLEPRGRHPASSVGRPSVPVEPGGKGG